MALICNISAHVIEQGEGADVYVATIPDRVGEVYTALATELCIHSRIRFNRGRTHDTLLDQHQVLLSRIHASFCLQTPLRRRSRELHFKGDQTRDGCTFRNWGSSFPQCEWICQRRPWQLCFCPWEDVGCEMHCA